MILALLLAAALCPHPHRSQAAVQMFVKAHPCPRTCATFVKRGGKFIQYTRCGACAVDHVCPLAACGLDAPRNMQWLDAKANREKSDDASLCTKELLDPVTGWKRDWEMPP